MRHLSLFILGLFLNSLPILSQSSFYDFEAKSIDGVEIPMTDFKGKYVLVVNTASRSIFTPQYDDLEKLYNEFKDYGFVVLGFPTNEFAEQEPGDEKSILEGSVADYGITFPMFAKTKLRGPDASPIFEYLEDEKGGRIKWNFTKFLISPDGKVVKRFNPRTSYATLRRYIFPLLRKDYSDR